MNDCPVCNGTGKLKKEWFQWNVFLRFCKEKVWQVVVHNDRNHLDPLERGSQKQELPDCRSIRELCMYAGPFEGEKKRKIIVIDED